VPETVFQTMSVDGASSTMTTRQETSATTSSTDPTTLDKKLLAVFHLADRHMVGHLGMPEYVALCKACMPNMPPKQYFPSFQQLDTNSDKKVDASEWVRECSTRITAFRANTDGSLINQSLHDLVELYDRGEVGEKLDAVYPEIAVDSTAPDDQVGKSCDTIWFACERGSLDAAQRWIRVHGVGLVNAPHPSTGKHSLLHAAPNNHLNLSNFLLELGAKVTPTTLLNSQNPRIRARLAQYKDQHINTEPIASSLTQLHLETVRDAVA
jgi:hypothetical protein